MFKIKDILKDYDIINSIGNQYYKKIFSILRKPKKQDRTSPELYNIIFCLGFYFFGLSYMYTYISENFNTFPYFMDTLMPVFFSTLIIFAGFIYRKNINKNIVIKKSIIFKNFKNINDFNITGKEIWSIIKYEKSLSDKEKIYLFSFDYKKNELKHTNLNSLFFTPDFTINDIKHFQNPFVFILFKTIKKSTKKEINDNKNDIIEILNKISTQDAQTILDLIDEKLNIIENKEDISNKLNEILEVKKKNNKVFIKNI